MQFRKLWDLRRRNIDNFLDSLLWETCSLTRDGVSERFPTIYVSVPLMAANTRRATTCVTQVSTVRVEGSGGSFLALWSAVLLRAVVRRRWHRHGDRLLLVLPGTQWWPFRPLCIAIASCSRGPPAGDAKTTKRHA